jgi:dCTP deaminase
MILTGSAIRQSVENGDILIDPFDPAQINPNSYDLRLASHVTQYTAEILDAAIENPTISYEIPPGGLVLQPHQLYLMATKERTSTSKYVPGVEGRSSTGRLGLSVHVTAGFGDIGFDGTWTLEVTVIKPLRIYANMRICQIFFETCSDVKPEDLYKGKYTGQQRPRPSRIWNERDEWLR